MKETDHKIETVCVGIADSVEGGLVVAFRLLTKQGWSGVNMNPIMARLYGIMLIECANAIEEEQDDENHEV